MSSLNNLPINEITNKFRNSLWLGNKKITLDTIITKEMINSEIISFKSFQPCNSMEASSINTSIYYLNLLLEQVV